MPVADEQLLDLVGRIYDCVMTPALWHETVDATRRYLRFQNAILAVNPLRPGYLPVVVSVGVPDEFLAMSQKFQMDMLELWGGPQRIARLPLEEPVIQSQQTDPATWHDNPYFREWVAPQGLVDAAALAIERDALTVANLALGRDAASGPIGDTELEGLRLIGPHLRRALMIGRLLETATNTARTFAAALDAISSGAILVDAHLRIIHANEAAEGMLRAGDPIRTAGARLELVDEIVPGQLQGAMAAMLESDAALGRRGMNIPARRRDGSTLTVNVMPLARRGERQGLPGAAVAAVFVSDAASRIVAPADTVTLIYGLTPAEARVFELVVLGHGSEEMARELGIATSTVRTHLLRVFAKTGRHDRSGLVRLAAELQPTA